MSRDRHRKPAANFVEKVGAKETRKLKARKGKGGDLWFGIGMFGLVGWSVAIPTLIGIAIGAWVDMNHPSRFSWTLMLMVAGVVLGCINAWYWASRFSKNE